MNALTEILPAPVLTSPIRIRRGTFGEIKAGAPDSIRALVEQVLRKIGFAEGVTNRNRRGGFDAFNADVYGFDAERNLVALQLRHSSKRRESDWLRTHKWYALAGIDEGQLFSHVIPSSFRRNPEIHTASPESVVRWAESKIFRVPVARLDTIIRQGDVALIPVRSIPRSAKPIDGKDYDYVFRGSHKISIDGTAYIDEATDRHWADGLVQIDHTPGQHRSIEGQGRFEIVIGERLDVNFSTID